MASHHLHHLNDQPCFFATATTSIVNVIPARRLAVVVLRLPRLDNKLADVGLAPWAGTKETEKDGNVSTAHVATIGEMQRRAHMQGSGAGRRTKPLIASSTPTRSNGVRRQGPHNYDVIVITS